MQRLAVTGVACNWTTHCRQLVPGNLERIRWRRCHKMRRFVRCWPRHALSAGTTTGALEGGPSRARSVEREGEGEGRVLWGVFCVSVSVRPSEGR
jgi:hypothetical protein